MRIAVIIFNILSVLGLALAFGAIFFISGLSALLEWMFDGNTSDTGFYFWISFIPLLVSAFVLFMNLISHIKFEHSKAFFAVWETICGVISGGLYGVLIWLNHFLDTSFFHASRHPETPSLSQTFTPAYVLGIALNVLVIVFSIIAACTSSKKAPAAPVQTNVQ